MNERLKDLSYKAVLLANEVFDYEGKEYFEIVQEKFAELLLEDVLDIVGYGGEFCSRPKLVEQIQTHFGVEE